VPTPAAAGGDGGSEALAPRAEETAPPVDAEPTVVAATNGGDDGDDAPEPTVDAPVTAALPYDDVVVDAGRPPAHAVVDDPSRSKSSRAIVEWVAVIVGALLVALVVKTFLFQAFYIPSESMEPTLEKGDRVIVNKLSYDLHDVHRGDVVVFELDKEDVGPDGIKDLIKRVIGLPGDTIETRDGAVYIDDRKLEEPYLPEGTKTGDPESGTNPESPRQVVPDGTVFVLGDNRDNSADSRYANRGPIPIDDIVGRAFILVWPPQDAARL
jgi:signal peptidase I